MNALRHSRSQVRRSVVASAAGILLALVPIAPGGGVDTASARVGCPAADRPVDGLSRAEARAATVCEIRRQRRLTGRAVVRPDAQLHTATRRHARLMVKQDCYEHICRGEASIEGRLFKSGYLRGARNWSYGENIGCATSVRQMIATWLANEPSRKILLGKAYRDIGATVTKGVPSEAQNCTSDPSYGTFTVLLAVRQPR